MVETPWALHELLRSLGGLVVVQFWLRGCGCTASLHLSKEATESCEQGLNYKVRPDMEHFDVEIVSDPTFCGAAETCSEVRTVGTMSKVGI